MIDVLNAWIHGLIQLFSWKAFALQLGGIAIRCGVGILPALGGAGVGWRASRGSDGGSD